MDPISPAQCLTQYGVATAPFLLARLASLTSTTGCGAWLGFVRGGDPG
jgi:hypothetical protein